MKKPFWIMLTTILLGLLIYQHYYHRLLLPRNEALPDREEKLVFRYGDDKGRHIGFINPDGSGFETRDVKVPTERDCLTMILPLSDIQHGFS